MGEGAPRGQEEEEDKKGLQAGDSGRAGVPEPHEALGRDPHLPAQAPREADPHHALPRLQEAPRPGRRRHVRRVLGAPAVRTKPHRSGRVRGPAVRSVRAVRRLHHRGLLRPGAAVRDARACCDDQQLVPAGRGHAAVHLVVARRPPVPPARADGRSVHDLLLPAASLAPGDLHERWRDGSAAPDAPAPGRRPSHPAQLGARGCQP
mmetsp:Transcript_6345/g.12639  ORF Transcript_6345/g.12639 Transcript_6345/m.12639 type:complete len:206 (+) Transcript_6345:605-1222(+)